MLRIGAISYLNTLPLIHGLRRDADAERVSLQLGTPTELAERLQRGELDVSLLSVAALGRFPGFGIVPGIGIATSGVCRSVRLISSRPMREVERLALDPQSHSGNRLAQWLCRQIWQRAPECVAGAASLRDSLQIADAAVRIGDKALFESVPEGYDVHDLSELWKRETGLPFVFAVWVARRELLDASLTTMLESSLDAGLREIDRIAADYRWRGEAHPETARDYLSRFIHYRLGADDDAALEMFLHDTLDPAVEKRG